MPPPVPVSAATFPVLAANEILESCQVYGCHLVGLEDLQDPKPAKVQAIYEWWMARILGLNAEDCVRAANAQLDATFDNPNEQSLYREAMYLGVFCQALNQFLTLAAIDDFTVKDLSAPSALRIRQVLSGIINFFLFEQEQAAEILEPLQDEQEELHAQETQLLQEMERLRNELADEREKHKLKAEKAEQLKREHREKQPELMAAKTLGLANAEWTTSSKEERAKSGEEIEMLKKGNSTLKVNLSGVQEQLIRSPDRVKLRLSEMADELAEEQAKFKKTADAMQQNERKIDSLVKYDQDLKACVDILQAWEADIGRMKDARDRFAHNQSVLESSIEQKADTENSIRNLQARLLNAIEASRRHDERLLARREGSKAKMASLESAQRELLAKKVGVEQIAAEKTRDAISVEESIKAMHADLHEELKRSEVAYNKIKDQVVAYSIALRAKLDSLNELNSLSLEL